jgi:hypothetical protein
MSIEENNNNNEGMGLEKKDSTPEKMGEVEKVSPEKIAEIEAKIAQEKLAEKEKIFKKTEEIKAKMPEIKPEEGPKIKIIDLINNFKSITNKTYSKEAPIFKKMVLAIAGGKDSFLTRSEKRLGAWANAGEITQAEIPTDEEFKKIAEEAVRDSFDGEIGFKKGTKEIRYIPKKEIKWDTKEHGGTTAA